MKKIIELLPLKIGDRAFTIKNYKGEMKIKCGEVSQMYFSDDMKLVISVKNVGRGLYGKKVFKTYLEAVEALENLQGEKTEKPEQHENNYYTERFNKVL